MKEMIYSNERKREMLDKGCINEGGYTFEYIILNLGTHPTAYISIPQNHKYYKKDWEDIDLQVHGGITYSESYLHLSEDIEISGWYIGWDYAHLMDWYGGDDDLELWTEFKRKKWTTEEILEEVKEAIKQLGEIK